MTQARRWAVRRLRAEILRLRIGMGLIVGAGLVLLFLIDHPMPGLLVVLGGFFLQAAVSSRTRRLRHLEHSLRADD
ncbi:hypothetical protein FB561_3498 [Kribbella amoyensis]|uniref:Uncharacterized protein n=1 Tax=Kribbella amoyensis TaxID=996641 RepID=A0A561BU47_9ACTN|nr:hypothetical protein [Kribbella amoyensis]TWD82368.1 hypothetical protein FB561_3498 [Kribbella amoyensis]